MRFTYELLWFFLIYSVIGWVGEVAVAAVRRHKFINRGFINGPMCPIYGVGAVAFSVFLPELKMSFFFLFLGGMVLGTFVEYSTGKVLEGIFHRKWWDYSRFRFHLDGYVCLPMSALWGVCAVIMIWWTNPIILWGLERLPSWMHIVAAWGLLGLLVIDGIGSVIAVMGLKRSEPISQITENMHRISSIWENALTHSIQKRMVKAYPNINPENAGDEVFAKGYGFYKLASLFFIGAVMGDLIETVFMLVTTHKLVCRSSVLYGPFSVVWGLGCVLLTMFLYSLREKNDRYIFLFGTVLGGVYEYVCSVFTERVFGAVFWNYSGLPFNLGGRINLLYCFFWGVVSVVWIKVLYPRLSGLIERIPKRAGKICCHLLIAFMIFDALISSMALVRYTQRYLGNEPKNAVEEFLDETYPDERMEKVYPYLRFRV